MRRYRSGQAIAIGRALGAVVAGSVLIMMTQEAFDGVRAEAKTQVTNTTAEQGLEYTAAFYSNFLFIVLGITILGTIAIAVYQRQGGV